MGQGHGDRLSSADAALLAMETPTEPLHAGGLFVFDAAGAGGFDFARLLALVRSRLHEVPRYRQRVAFAPLNLAAPVWVDDVDFDIAYHVRHAALPRPGTMPQLMEYCARVLSRPLDRDRPLWELYVIEGLEDERVAVLAKNHQALIDGIAGLDLTSVLLDQDRDASGRAATDPATGSVDIPPPEPWSPEPEPRGYELAWSGMVDLVSSPAALLESGRQMAAAPAHAARRALRVGRGVAAVARASLVRPAPQSLLNVAPGPHRRFAIQRLSLEDVRTVKNAFDTTVHDVVLALAADATGRYLRSRGTRTDGLWLRALAPVGVRTDDDQHALGHRVVSVFANLPMAEMDPVERLRICSDAMQEVQWTHQAAGAGFLLGLTRFAPPTIHAMAARLAARGRLFNFLVTNVPGPQEPISCLGARLVGAFPFTPLTSTHAYAIGVTSIDGWLDVGITAGYDALPDVEDVTDHLRSALGDLVASAEAVVSREELAARAHRRAQETAEAARQRVQAKRKGS